MRTTTTKSAMPVVRPLLKTPISYYGGKQSMLKDILPLIPPHKIYTEVFFGGGAVFWAKEPSDVEIINDINLEVVNFYRELKGNYPALKKLIDGSLHSRTIHDDAQIIFKHPHLFTKTVRAWALWVNANQGFGCALNSGWGYGNDNKTPLKQKNKKAAFTQALSDRLDSTQIECYDALKIIKARDTEETFHYIDPPYIEVHQGHYHGYLRSDFEELLKLLEGLKGKFLLSTYPTDILEEYTNKNGWHTKMIDKPLGVHTVKGGTRKRKIEVLTANFEI